MNMAQNGICIAAIDVIAPGVSDTNTTHTHFYIYETTLSTNIVPGCDQFFDGEDYMFDTLGILMAPRASLSWPITMGGTLSGSCIKIRTATERRRNTQLLKIYQNTCY